MKLLLAGHNGFCFGVRRAVDMAESCAASGGTVRTLGPIIHNERVLERLEADGITVVTGPEGLREGDTVILRAHGVTPAEETACHQAGATVQDATCPFVTRIHHIADRAREEGVPLYVAGEPEHPEVRGILGHAGGCGQVLKSATEASQLTPCARACLVAQTTFDREDFLSIRAIATGRVRELTVYDTICDTTRLRQQECREIATRADMMVVIGSQSSANTRRLVEIAKKHCANTILVDDTANFFLDKSHSFGIIGVVAGASTPDWMIREVIELMSELENTTIETVEAVVAAEAPAVTEEVAAAVEPAAAAAPAEVEEATDFATVFEQSENVKIHNGSTLTGTVMYVKDGVVYVGISNYKADGIIPKGEYSTDPAADPAVDLHEGDEIDVEVLKLNDGEGNVLLSHKNAEGKKLWDELMAEAENPEKIYEATGKEVVKGGVIADINGIRAFVPASLVSTRFVQDLTQFVGQPMRVKILEVDKQRKRVVASQKAVLLAEAEAAKAEKWAALKAGEKVTGTVRRITDFGAFVDIGGIDGLVHVTDCGWGHVKHPSDVLSIGQEIEVLILNVDVEKKRVSLGYKQLQPKPWTTAAERYPVGSIVEGKVVRIVPFGAFVALESTIDGLIHISQVGVSRIAKVEDEINVGDTVRCKVLEVNPEAKRISLSRKEALLEEDEELRAKVEAEKEERNRQYQERKEQREREREQQQTQRRERSERSASQSSAPRQERQSRGPRHSEDGDYELPEVQNATTSLADLFAGLKLDQE